MKHTTVGVSFIGRICCLSLLSLVLLGGCATIGHDFAASDVPKIQIGKTTQNEIVSMFGSPWRTGMEDGRPTWTYGKYYYSLFSEARAQDLVIRFDNKGVVYSYTYNTTANGQ
jgi:hypothetical protein